MPLPVRAVRWTPWVRRIFVDDNKANAQAAYNLGITGILYKNPKSFTRALGACGIEVE